MQRMIPIAMTMKRICCGRDDVGLFYLPNETWIWLCGRRAESAPLCPSAAIGGARRNAEAIVRTDRRELRHDEEETDRTKPGTS